MSAACGGKGAPRAPAATPPALGEPVYAEWSEEPLSADLDGDGNADAIEFACEPAMRAAVGAMAASVPVEFSELMGCSAAVVALGGRPYLMVMGHEHEEVGAPTYVLFGFDGTAMRVVWQGAGELTLHAGAWTLATSECHDEGRIVVTTDTYWVDGAAVREASAQTEDAIEPGSCGSGP